MWRQSLYGTCCYLSISFHTTYQYRTQSAFRMKLTTVWFFPHTLSVNIKLTAINFNGPVFLILYTTPVWNSLSSWTKTYSSTLFQYRMHWALVQRHTLQHYSSMGLVNKDIFFHAIPVWNSLSTWTKTYSSMLFQYGTHWALEQRHTLPRYSSMELLNKDTLPRYSSMELAEHLNKDILLNTIPVWNSLST